jgi:signal transduction histidine kinase
LLLNAIEHGNLGFGYAEQASCLEDGTWSRRVAERQRRPEAAARSVGVAVTWERDRVVIVIRDEGSGFDWRNLPDPTDSENLLAAQGRGLLMARVSVDSLQLNEAGYEVKIVKTLSGSAQSQQAVC